MSLTDPILQLVNRALSTENDAFKLLYPALGREAAVRQFHDEAEQVREAEDLPAFWMRPMVTERLMAEHRLDLDSTIDAIMVRHGAIVPFAVDFYVPLDPCLTLPPCHVALPLLAQRDDGHGVVGISVPGIQPTEAERAALARFYGLREVSLVSVTPPAMRGYLDRLIALTRKGAGRISFEPRPAKEWPIPASNGRNVHLRLTGFRPPAEDHEASRLWQEIDPRLTSTHLAVPVYVSPGIVTLAVPDGTPTAKRATISNEIATARRGTNARSVRWVFAPKEDIEAMQGSAGVSRLRQLASKQASRVDVSLATNLPGTTTTEEASVVIMESKTSDPTISLAQTLLTMATELGASDLVVDASMSGLLVRYRVRGAWQTEMQDMPAAVGEALMGRLKALARIQNEQRRKPRAGSISFRNGDTGKEYLFRVEHIQHGRGEEMTLRVQPNDKVPPLANLAGMQSWLTDFLAYRVMNRDHGLFVVSGPVGSGKTTTLHAMLSGVNRTARRVITLENPVERYIDGVNHVEVLFDEENPRSPMSLGWAEGMRSALRRAPDIILIGEIRDHDTAKTALDGATTGHLTLGTVHSASSMDVGQRINSLGGDPGLFVDAFIGALAQRLVAIACPHCCEYGRPDDAICSLLGVDPKEFAGIDEVVIRINQHGCNHGQCSRGRTGRLGLYELSSIDDDDDRDALARATFAEARGDAMAVKHALRDMLRKKGRKTLRDSARDLVKTGAMALEEYARR